MHPVHDIDVLVFLATAMAAKRRPAELLGIVAAADLLQGFVPTEAKLREAFDRLGTAGLLVPLGEGYALAPVAEEIISGQPKKGDTTTRIAWTKEQLAAYQAKADNAPIVLTTEQVLAAMAAHQASARSAGKNLLMPKPKAVENRKKRFGQWYKPAAMRKHKA